MAVSREARAVGRVTLVVWVAVAFAAALWMLLGGGAFVERLGLSALIGGALLMLTGGTVMARTQTLATGRWGVRVNPHRDQDVPETGGLGVLTALGLSLLVGGPLFVLGALLLL